MIGEAHVHGFAFGYSLGARFLYAGAIFYLGALQAGSEDEYKKIFQAILIILASYSGAGSAFSRAPSKDDAKIAANKIFEIIDEQTQIDVQKEKERKEIALGRIEFVNVSFTYPGETTTTLKNFHLVIPSGKRVGIMGHMGCGKSTIVNLLLKLY